MEELTRIEYKKDATIHTANSLLSAWYKLCERIGDWSDLLYCWLHRNEKKISLEEFLEEVDKMNKADVQSSCR
jgi:hypothetical protein